MNQLSGDKLLLFLIELFIIWLIKLYLLYFFSSSRNLNVLVLDFNSLPTSIMISIWFIKVDYVLS